MEKTTFEMYPSNSYRTISVFYPKGNQKYEDLKKLLKQDNIVKSLNDNKIVIYDSIRDDINDFIAYLSDFNMAPLETFHDLTESTIQKIIQLCKKLDSNNQKGGNINYKSEYNKYKNKYMMAKI